MPTSRPSSPASLSTTNAIALNASQIWLVDATSGSTIPDLLAGNAMSVNNATYVTDTSIGRALASSGTGIQVAMDTGVYSPLTAAYPFGGGGVFNWSTGISSGTYVLAAWIDSLADSGSIQCFVYLETDFNVYMQWRAISGDANGSMLLGAATQGVNVWSIFLDSYNSGHCSMNGSGNGTINPPTDPGWDSSLRYGDFSWLCMPTHSRGAVSFVADSHLREALVWRAQGSTARTAITNTVIDAWTGDPWTILLSGSGSSNGGGSFTLAGATDVAAGGVTVTGSLS